MELLARPVSVEEILPWRDLYRQEMNCQIIHDSLHSRQGWTQSYLLRVGEVTAGYGSIALGGPWKGKPALFEFYVAAQYRSRMFDLFSALLSASAPLTIEVQSNDPLLTVMLHAFADKVFSDSILFHDKLTTTHWVKGAHFRGATNEDAPQIASSELDRDAKWVVASDGVVAAAGDILFHYNRPYGDIYMKVAERFQRRGIGSFLVQELKRVCYEQGSVPAARCNPKNIASRKTLQKAGFVPCGHILIGSVSV
jgi:GNAT superfamily N-acetyltransferase